MTWLVWRRYRVTVGLALGVLFLLGIWMAWQVHAFETTRQSAACVTNSPNCAFGSNRFFSLNVAVSAANFALDVLPCALGVVFGAPLVAGELELRTNRLVWTQGLSRTRWLMTKYVLLLGVLVAAVAGLTLVAQWWSGHVDQPGLLLHTLPAGKVGPGYFPVTGVVAVGYTVLAFNLGAVAGAFLRRTGWAIAATIVVYVVAVLFLLSIRPDLASQSFTPWYAHSGVQYPGQHLPSNSWDLGSGYRYKPGYGWGAGQSAGGVAQGCQSVSSIYEGPAFFTCIARDHVEVVELYQPASNYWALQWREAAALAAASAVCVAGTVVAVRRWQA